MTNSSVAIVLLIVALGAVTAVLVRRAVLADAATTVDRTVDPADFGDPNALNLGECSGGTIETAALRVLSVVATLSQAFGTERVQFNFNGTPAVVESTMLAEDVLADWDARRTAYQKAAGIV